MIPRGPSSQLGGSLFWVLAVLTAASGAVLVWIATSRYGPGLTPDSVGYLSAAKNLATGRGLVLYNDSLYVDWPPLFPAFLALVGETSGLAPVEAARLFNALAFAGVILCGTALLGRHLAREAPLRMVGVTGLLLSVPLYHTSVMAWSEPLFVVLTLGFLLALGSYLETPRDGSFWLACGFAALAGLTRYAGVTLLLTGVVSLMLATGWAWRDRIRTAVVFTVAASYPLALWLARNLALTGTPFGSRSASAAGFGEPMLAVVDVLGQWVVPGGTPFRAILLAVFAAVALGTVVMTVLDPPRFRRSFVPLGIFVLVYLAFLVVSAALVRYDPIDNRLLSPLWVPLLVVALAALQRGFPSLRDFGLHPALAGTCVIAAVTGWLFLSLGRIGSDLTTRLVEGGGGYNTTSWHQSETVRYLRRIDPGDGRLVYSNAPDLCYALAGVRALFVPPRPGYRQKDADEGLQSLRTWWPPGDAYVVWFRGIDRSYLFTPEELRGVADLDPVARPRDGAVYRASSASRMPGWSPKRPAGSSPLHFTRG